MSAEKQVEKRSGRNGEIDILRFLFCLSIVGRHFFVPYKLGVFNTAAIGVEFFFIVSGYLMAKSADNARKSADNLEIGTSTWSYTMRKVRSFYPYYLCAMIVQVVFVDLLLEGESISKFYDGFVKSIPSFTLIFMGLANKVNWYVPSTWFLSSLLIASFMLYPLLLSKYDVATKILCPLIAMFTVGYAYISTGFIWMGTTFETWNGIAISGLVRGISELALGVGLYPLSMFIQKKYSGKGMATNIVVTLIKLYCYFMVLEYILGIYKRQDAIYILLFLCIGIALSFSDVGFVIPDNKVTRFLGKVSLPIYIFHGIMRHVCLEYFKPENTSPKKAFALTCASILISIILMLITDFIMKLLQKKK